MNYETGMRCLRARLSGSNLSDLGTLEYRLSENLRSERIFGTSETVRAERAAIVAALNELSYRELNLSFVEICSPTRTENEGMGTGGMEPRQGDKQPTHFDTHIPKLKAVRSPLEKYPSHSNSSLVFISYSWESEHHREWVRQLAVSLRTDGLAAVLDQWHCELGERFPEFMEQSVTQSDFVLVICTPEYKKRFDQRRGGVGYEGHIISASLVSSFELKTFIPVLRSGDWIAALPSALAGVSGVDLRGDPFSIAEYRKLVKTLHRLKSAVPPVGARPKWLMDIDI